MEVETSRYLVPTLNFSWNFSNAHPKRHRITTYILLIITPRQYYAESNFAIFQAGALCEGREFLMEFRANPFIATVKFLSHLRAFHSLRQGQFIYCRRRSFFYPFTIMIKANYFTYDGGHYSDLPNGETTIFFSSHLRRLV